MHMLGYIMNVVLRASVDAPKDVVFVSQRFLRPVKYTHGNLIELKPSQTGKNGFIKKMTLTVIRVLSGQKNSLKKCSLRNP